VLRKLEKKTHTGQDPKMPIKGKTTPLPNSFLERPQVLHFVGSFLPTQLCTRRLRQTKMEPASSDREREREVQGERERESARSWAREDRHGRAWAVLFLFLFFGCCECLNEGMSEERRRANNAGDFRCVSKGLVEWVWWIATLCVKIVVIESLVGAFNSGAGGNLLGRKPSFFHC